MLLGAIADDLTGATDLALTLSRGGMRTVQFNGLPSAGVENVDAVIVALKSRTIPVSDAVGQSLAAVEWLVGQGAEQIYFKYCSTFDSTDEGNIGPVTEALMDFLKVDKVVVCPAFPANRRTVYQGHLFAGGQLLSDSPMKDHPLTPMRDSNIVRVLQKQVRRKVDLIASEVVRLGAPAIGDAIASAGPETMLVIDAIVDKDLHEIGKALTGSKLVTGASGLALGLPENFRRAGKLSPVVSRTEDYIPSGRAVVLAGSCSTATRRQVAYSVSAGTPAFRVDPLDISAGEVTAAEVAEWVIAQAAAAPLVYSSSEPSEVAAAQDALGIDTAGSLVEGLLADVASILEDRGFNRFLVAGGETSGAVVAKLDVRAVIIGEEIDPGVPWTFNLDEKRPIALALKSGNFGTDDFFVKAWSVLE